MGPALRGGSLPARSRADERALGAAQQALAGRRPLWLTGRFTLRRGRVISVDRGSVTRAESTFEGRGCHEIDMSERWLRGQLEID